MSHRHVGTYSRELKNGKEDMALGSHSVGPWTDLLVFGWKFGWAYVWIYLCNCV